MNEWYGPPIKHLGGLAEIIQIWRWRVKKERVANVCICECRLLKKMMKEEKQIEKEWSRKLTWEKKCRSRDPELDLVERVEWDSPTFNQENTTIWILKPPILHLSKHTNRSPPHTTSLAFNSFPAPSPWETNHLPLYSSFLPFLYREQRSCPAQKAVVLISGRNGLA